MVRNPLIEGFKHLIRSFDVQGKPSRKTKTNDFHDFSKQPERWDPQKEL